MVPLVSSLLAADPSPPVLDVAADGASKPADTAVADYLDLLARTLGAPAASLAEGTVPAAASIAVTPAPENESGGAVTGAIGAADEPVFPVIPVPVASDTSSAAQSFTAVEERVLSGPEPITEATPSVSVYRMLNTVTGTHFYTISAPERDTILKTLPTYRYEGVAFKAFDVGIPEQTVSVYRFFNTATGTHFYTASGTERDATTKLSAYTYEGIAYLASATAEGGLDPLYRFFNQNTGAHFYTASEAERSQVAKLVGFVYEGIAYYVDA